MPLFYAFWRSLLTEFGKVGKEFIAYVREMYIRNELHHVIF